MLELVTAGGALTHVLMGYAVCAGLIASGAADLEAAAARALEAPPPTTAPVLERIRRKCLAALATWRSGQAALRARAAEEAAAAVAGADGGLDARIRAGDPERLATAWLGADARSFLRVIDNETDVSDVALGAPALVLGERAEMLYAPRAVLEAIEIP